AAGQLPDLHIAGLRDCGTGQRGPVRRGRVLRSWHNPRRGFVRPVPARASPEARGRSPRPPPLLAGLVTPQLRPTDPKSAALPNRRERALARCVGAGRPAEWPPLPRRHAVLRRLRLEEGGPCSPFASPSVR